MQAKKTILLGMLVLMIIPIISANPGIEDDCPGCIIGETGATIELGEGLFCPRAYNYTKWIDSSQDPFVFYPTVDADPRYDCRDFLETDENMSCCPRYSECREISSPDITILPVPGTSQTGNPFTCVVSTKIHCSQFETQDECVEASKPIAIEAIESSPDYETGWCFHVLGDSWPDGDEVCWNQTSCECVWDDTEGCLANAEISTECDGIAIPPILIEDCEYLITDNDDACGEIGGMIIRNWVDIKNLPECENASSEIPCTDVVRLGFFTWINVIVVIVILVVIYYLYNSKKSKKKKKK